MLRLYKLMWVFLLLLGSLASIPHFSLAQCSITNLQPNYCTDDPVVPLAGGSTYYGPGISGSNFSPLVADVGTHTIYSSDGVATSYGVSTVGSFNPDPTLGSMVNFPLAPADENSGLIPLGFSFNFFGTNYTDITVNANGYVAFGGPVSSGVGQILPDATAPNNLIAGAWGDLDILLGGTVTARTTVPTALDPFKKFIIDFTNVRFAGSPETVSFQIHLQETTNIIEIHGLDIQDNGGPGTTQGIENAAGSAGYAIPSRNLGNWTATSDYVAFVPSCVDVRTVTVSAPPSSAIAFSAPPSVCPGSGATVTIPSPQIDVLYQLHKASDDSAISAIYSGTGPLILTSDPLAASTAIKVYAVNLLTGCDALSATSVTVAPNFVAPIITGQPSTSIICQGANTTFTVNAGLTTSPSYQWQESTNGGVSYSNLANGGIYSGV
ncbi:MAG TPA: hypothetical protein VK666_00615, partial [Chryseolinea sp.]|nr:hypothetical protein [Chryseolinea sp.]